MTQKRFERIYADVDVFCRDHNAKGTSQLLEKEDYDIIVDLLNEQHEQIEDLKDVNVRCCNEYSYFHKRMMELEKENEQLKQSNERIVKDIDLALGFIRHKGYSLQDIKDYEDAKKEYEEELANYRKGDVE